MENRIQSAGSRRATELLVDERIQWVMVEAFYGVFMHLIYPAQTDDAGTHIW